MRIFVLACLTLGLWPNLMGADEKATETTPHACSLPYGMIIPAYTRHDSSLAAIYSTGTLKSPKMMGGLGEYAISQFRGMKSWRCLVVMVFPNPQAAQQALQLNSQTWRTPLWWRPAPHKGVWKNAIACAVWSGNKTTVLYPASDPKWFQKFHKLTRGA